MTRYVLGAIFILASLPFGALIGAYIGTRYFVPGGAGLANPVVGIWYGGIGAAIAGVLAILATATFSTKWLWAVSVPVIVVGAIFALMIAVVLLNAKSKQKADLDQAYSDLNAFTISLSHGGPGATFTKAELDGGGRTYKIVTSEERPRTCTARMSGKEAAALLTSLRNIGVLLAGNPDPCAGSSDAPVSNITWRIEEAKPPDTEGTLTLSASCAAQHPELGRPFELAADMLKSGDHARRCE